MARRSTQNALNTREQDFSRSSAVSALNVVNGTTINAERAEHAETRLLCEFCGLRVERCEMARRSTRNALNTRKQDFSASSAVSARKSARWNSSHLTPR